MVVANGDRLAGNSALGKVPQKLCLLSPFVLQKVTDKNEKSVIISTVPLSVMLEGGKPHLVQGMHGGMEYVMARYTISAAA